jgi:hypothetical protein
MTAPPGSPVYVRGKAKHQNGWTIALLEADMALTERV